MEIWASPNLPPSAGLTRFFGRACLLRSAQVGKFGAVLEEAPGGRGLLVGAPYTGLGLSNYGKVGVEEHGETLQVYFFPSSTSLPEGDVTSQCGLASQPCPDRCGEGERERLPRWAEAVLTRHEEGSMFGGSLASTTGARVGGRQGAGSHSVPGRPPGGCGGPQQQLGGQAGGLGLSLLSLI